MTGFAVVVLGCFSAVFAGAWLFNRLVLIHDRAVAAAGSLLVLSVIDNQMACLDGAGNIHVVQIVPDGARVQVHDDDWQPGDVFEPEPLAQHLLAYQAMLG